VPLFDAPSRFLVAMIHIPVELAPHFCSNIQL